MSHGLASGFHCPPLDISAAIALLIPEEVFRDWFTFADVHHVHIDFRAVIAKLNLIHAGPH
jgi:hypothetical protein